MTADEWEDTLADIVIEGAVVLIAWLLVPAVWADRGAPLRRRIWRWRFVCGVFAVATAIGYGPRLLAGEWQYLAAAPFIHVVSVLGVLDAMTTAVSVAYLPPFIPATVAAGLSAGVLVLEAGRRRFDGLGPLPAIPLKCDEAEMVVPLVSTEEKSDGAGPHPTLAQDVSTAVLGETGSGKTSAMELLAAQFPYDQNTAVVAHDFGGEFAEFYEQRGFDVVRVSVEDADVAWNLFNDVAKERDLDEVAEALFGEPTGENPFHGPAKQVFGAGLRYLYREADRQDKLDELGHDQIVDLFAQEPAELYETLGEYDDLQSQAGHINPDGGKGAQNVYQRLHECVDPVFIDEFAGGGSFSLRDYLNDPQGRVIVLDSPVVGGDAVAPMYRLLIDWSIKHAMTSPTPAVFVLDEIDQLPELNEVGDLAARGRSEGARAILGVQSVSQLREQYGPDGARGVLGNCPQGLYFGPGERMTTEYVQDELGQRRVETTQRSISEGKDRVSTTTSRREEDRHPVPPETLKRFGPGDAVVVSRTEWWIGQVAELEAVEDRL